jgi:DNA repair protein RadD
MNASTEIHSIFNRGQDALLISPTGSGKTVMWTKVVKNLSRDRDVRVLVVVPRISLVYQAVKELQEWGLDVGLIVDGEKERRRAQVQVATYQSIASRGIEWLDPNYIVLDECHLSAFPKSIREIIPTIHNYWQFKARVLGVTATPHRTDKHTSLGELFLPQNIVFAPSIAELIDMGYLVKPTYVICPNAVSKMMVFDPEYVLATYKITDGRPTIVFAPSVPKAKHMAQRFRDEGIDAEVVHGKTPTGVREKLFERFNNEELPVLVNCCVLREGIDLPVATNLILGIDPDSRNTYTQVIGRVMRTATYKDGTIKTTANIYDLTGCVDRHKRVEEYVYTIDDLDLPDLEVGEVPMKPCPNDFCDSMSFISAKKCSKCGAEFEIKKRRTVLPEGRPYLLLNQTERQHKAVYEELLIEAFNRGDRPSAARIEFARQFEYTPPPVWRLSCVGPGPEFQDWLLTEGRRAQAHWEYKQLSLDLVF